MTDWDKAADEAMEKTDAQLAAGLVKLMGLDIDALFPVKADAEKVEAYIEKIKRETVHNERLAAVKAVGVILGEDLAKVVKAAIFTLLLAFICVPAYAQEAEQKPMLDFSAFFRNARLGYSVNQHMERNTVLYAPFKRYSPVNDVELLNCNIGYDMAEKHPIIMLGVRLDNADKLLWNSDWSKKHITSATIPTIEFGPYASAWPRKIAAGKVAVDFWYGVIGAIGF
jgi:hypothetical protein